MIRERLQFGYRFMNRMKPASDMNMPEGTVMVLRSARHLPPRSVDSRETEKWRFQKCKKLQWSTDILQTNNPPQNI